MDASGFGMGTLGLGIFVIIISILGGMSGKYMRPCFIIPFVVCAGFLALGFFIIAAISMGAGTVFKQAKGIACQNAGIIKD